MSAVLAVLHFDEVKLQTGAPSAGLAQRRARQGKESARLPISAGGAAAGVESGEDYLLVETRARLGG